MKTLYLLIFLLSATVLSAQINCNVYKWSGDSACYQACQVFDNARYSIQGSRFSQSLYDSVITICPNFDMAYMEKAVPYLKRGDFITWRQWIDKAVALNPKEHLGYRGWCRYQFLRDYAGALADLQALEQLQQPDIGYAVNGAYHLKIAEALCYKGLGDKEKAIQTIETQLKVPGYSPGYYDYIHLAVLKLETGKIEEAIALLEKQLALSADFAEVHYYLAKAYKQSGRSQEQIQESLNLAMQLYTQGRHFDDPYDNPMDRIYRSDIAEALKEW